jgi:hypothetical protein
MIFSNIAHELRLQPLGTELAADMKRALAIGNLLVPGTQIKNRLIEVRRRGPHQPPTIAGLLQNAAIGAGAAIEAIGRRICEIPKFHQLDTAPRTRYFTGNRMCYEEINCRFYL